MGANRTAAARTAPNRAGWLRYGWLRGAGRRWPDRGWHLDQRRGSQPTWSDRRLGPGWLWLLRREQLWRLRDDRHGRGDYAGGAGQNGGRIPGGWAAPRRRGQAGDRSARPAGKGRGRLHRDRQGRPGWLGTQF